MKLFCVLMILGLFQACDPYGFGFKMNPAYVLNEAFESVMALDHEGFLEVSGKEALCLYGNPEGITYLRTNLKVDARNTEIKPKLLENSSKYTKSPHFVGYWSYYQERYLIDVLDKGTQKEMLKVIVECHYGFAGEKSDKYQNLKTKKYKKRECRLIKVIPLNFEPLPIRTECIPLKVTL